MVLVGNEALLMSGAISPRLEAALAKSPDGFAVGDALKIISGREVPIATVDKDGQVWRAGIKLEDLDREQLRQLVLDLIGLACRK